jgi:hypothetical protein
VIIFRCPLKNEVSSELRNRRSLTVYVLKKCVIAPSRDRQKLHAPRFISGPSLIELGGLVVKAGIVGLTGNDRTTILGALIWIAEKLKGDQRERARALWAAMGKQAFDMEPAAHKGADHSDPRFLRVAPLSAACIGSSWALQSLWAAAWLTDVEGFDHHSRMVLKTHSTAFPFAI